MIQPTKIPRLRILHIISGDRWAGAEVQAYTLLKEFNKYHDVSAIVLNQGELARCLKDLHIPNTIYNETQLNSWQIFKGIKQTLKAINPDIVHTHRQKENILGSIANRLSIRTLCVRTVHGDTEFNPAGIAKLQSILDNLCGRYLQQVIIAVSGDLHQKLKKQFSSNKIYTVLNGIDPEEVRNGLKYPDFKKSMPNKLHIGIVGRVDPVKRIDIFLQMSKLLLQNHPEMPWFFHLFGEGRLEAKMKQLSDTIGIAGKVIFHGHQVDIKDCIYGLNAVVMCSDHEGLPMTALESIAIGTPLIAHNIGGLTDLLKNYPNWLVENHTAKGYADAVVESVINEVPKMVFPEKYNINKTASNTSQLYFSKLNINTQHQEAR